MPGRHGRRWSSRIPLLAVGFGVLVVLVLAPAAQADEPPPSQELRTDPGRPTTRVSIALDPIALYRKQIGVELDVALGRWQSLALVPALFRGEGDNGLGLEVAYRLRPFGHALDGLFLQASVGLVGWRREPKERWFQVGVFSGFVLGGSFGVVHRWEQRPNGPDGSARGYLPNARLLLGYAF